MKDISTSTLQTILIILTCIYIFILTPISLYHARKLWTLRNQNIVYITKRHPKVVITTIIFLNIWPTIIRPITNFGNLYYPGIWTIMVSNTVQYIMGFICVRMWLLYYDYTYELHALSRKWKAQLADNDPDKLHIPWSIRHKWLGSSKIITAIPLIMGSIFIAIVGYVLPTIFLVQLHYDHHSMCPLLYWQIEYVLQHLVMKQWTSHNQPWWYT